MHFKSLKNRIAVTFLTLIFAIQLLGFIAIRISIEENARKSINEQLQVGEQVFHNLLSQIVENLSQSARILATDYGFRQAIGSNDGETIHSALENSRARVNAGIAMFYSADGMQKEVVGDIPLHVEEQKITRLVKVAELEGNTHDLIVFNNRAYQVVVEPIKAPLVIGWIVMGFAIDDETAKKLQSILSLQVSFLTQAGHNNWTISASTLDSASQSGLTGLIPADIPKDAMTKELALAETEYGTRLVKVFKSDNQAMIAILQRSIQEATAPYKALQLNLLVLTLLGAIVFTLGSIWTARRIVQPITELVSTAESLEQGNYDTQITVNREDEIGQLARGFDQMRDAIALRERNIRRLAYWDDLTQLPNRVGFIDYLGKAIDYATTTNQPLSILMMDLDRFKQINDVLGHAAANELLKGVAERLQQISRSERGDIVTRLGGDKFAVLLPGTDPVTATSTANRMLKALEEPIIIQDQKVDLSAGMGIASFPEHADELDQLLSRAEMAMYVAKAAKTGVMLYEPGFDASAQENLSLASELRVAIERSQLSLYVQPKIELASGQMLSVEALVRWIHPERGMISPDTFIPFAEQTGLVRKISLWMFDEAARRTVKWRQKGLNVVVAINLSARDLIDQDLPNKLALILYKYNLQPDAISLEITESSIMDDPARAQLTLERLSKMGMRLAIDDFGTGFSSLAYLKRLPVDELKIDKSFVMNMEKDIDDAKIVRSTIDLGHNLGLKVVAEGVENQAVWDLLRGMGCDYGQGYFMSKPMPADTLEQWAEQWQASRH